MLTFNTLTLATVLALSQVSKNENKDEITT